jgi:hypothetical protein
MKTRYTYLGDSTIEVVVDGEEVQVNILPVTNSPQLETSEEALDAESASAPDGSITQSSGVQLPPPLPLEAAVKPQRGLHALVRAMWSAVFYLLGVAAAGLVYVQDKVDQLGLPTWVAVAVGAVVSALGYGLKKYYKPDGLL